MYNNFKKHSLCFKLVGGEDVCQRHYFVLVDRQQFLWNILEQAAKTVFYVSTALTKCQTVQTDTK